MKGLNKLSATAQLLSQLGVNPSKSTVVQTHTSKDLTWFYFYAGARKLVVNNPGFLIKEVLGPTQNNVSMAPKALLASLTDPYDIYDIDTTGLANADEALKRLADQTHSQTLIVSLGERTAGANQGYYKEMYGPGANLQTTVDAIMVGKPLSYKVAVVTYIQDGRQLRRLGVRINVD
jgi:hypothetical protein